MAKKRQHKILDFHFENDNHVMAYIHYLLAEDLAYHFDDNPHTIKWEADLDTLDKMHLTDNHERLWAYCDPWEWFDKHPQMWSLWTGGTEVSPQCSSGAKIKI